MKIAYIFPGQGSQAVGMGRELFHAYPEAREVFEAADEAVGFRLSSLCFEGPDDALRLTKNGQPAILTTSLAAHAVFSRRGPAPALLAGHSLGEFSAYAAAGTFTLRDAVLAVRARGTYMQDAVPVGVGAMAAILGVPPEQVREACAAASQGETVSPANYNSPEQTVIAGHAAAVERASGTLAAVGAKVVPLAVSAPFHCSLMDPVKPRLLDVLGQLQLSAPKAPVVTNVEAKPNEELSRIVPLLIEQVTSPVRWVETIEELVRQGVTHVVELGHGKVLCGLVKRIHKGIKLLNVEDKASLEKALTTLGAQEPTGAVVLAGGHADRKAASEEGGH